MSVHSLISSFFRVLIFSVLLTSCNVISNSEPEEALDFIHQRQEGLVEPLFTYLQNMEVYDSAQLEEAYRLVLNIAEGSLDEIRQMPPPEGDTVFVSAAIELFFQYHQAVIIELDSMKTHILRSKTGHQYTVFHRSLSERIREAEKNYIKAQNNFRREHVPHWSPIKADTLEFSADSIPH
ncbi:MAG: hypothetical protein Q7J34_00585 [Bacteroidales bacterium]|nr:hypothetical protein [Bacteroidales bacterium]